MREAEIARARKEAEEAQKDREAAIRAHKEAEEAKKDREREEAQAAKARKEAEDARKSREAAIKARKEAEEAEESRRAKEAAREQREAEKARRVLEPKKAGKARTAWIWAVIGIIIISAVGITLRYTVFNSDSGITKPPTNTEKITSGETTTSPPTSSGPTTTLADTTAPPLTEYVDFDFNPAILKKSAVQGEETFYAHISGNIACVKDLPLNVSAIRVVTEIIARNNLGGGEVILNSSGNITLESVPAITGETAGFNQDIPLNFPAGTESGNYNIVMKMKETKIDIGWWVDVADYFDLTQELSLGVVSYTITVAYNYVEGHILDAFTNAPITAAQVKITRPDDPNSYALAFAYSDDTGYYKITGLTDNGPFIVQVIVHDYRTQYYADTYDKTKATPVKFEELGKTITIDFKPERTATISGKITSDVDGKGIGSVLVAALDPTTNMWWVATTSTYPDGSYELSGLVPGDYCIKAVPSSNKLPYADEHYDNIFDAWSAPIISAASGQNVSNIDISLAPGGSLSGTVRNADGTAPLAGVWVDACLIVNGNNTGWFSVSTDSEGNYNIYGLRYGDYTVRARGGSSETNYVQEWYPEKIRQGQALLVTVNDKFNPAGIDFTLEKGGSVSGKVISDATLKGLCNIHVYAVDYETGEWLNGDFTAIDGTYTIHGLPAGKLKIITSASLNNSPYIDEYYSNTTDSNLANRVYVTSGKDTPSIDFSLASKTS